MLREIGRNRWETAAAILQWVVTSLRPLTLAELADATNVPASDVFSRDQIIRDQVRFYGSLFTVIDYEVELVHQSAKDYLQRKDPDEDAVLDCFCVKREEANLVLLRRCFGYIRQPLEFSPISLNDSTSSRYFPLLNYAVVSGPEYARLSPETVADIFDFSGPFCLEGSKLFKHWWLSYRSGRRDEREPESFSLLQMASYFDIVPLARKVLHDPDWKRNLCLDNATKVVDSERWTPLFYAGYKSKDEMVRLLLQNGARILCQRTSMAGRHSCWPLGTLVRRW